MSREIFYLLLKQIFLLTEPVMGDKLNQMKQAIMLKLKYF